MRGWSFDEGQALIAVLWAYEGWHVLSFTAGEFKNVQRDLPRGLFYGTLIVVVTYLLANAGYYCVLATSQIQHTERVAAMAVGSVLGGRAASLISVAALGITLSAIVASPLHALLGISLILTGLPIYVGHGFSGPTCPMLERTKLTTESASQVISASLVR